MGIGPLVAWRRASLRSARRRRFALAGRRRARRRASSCSSSAPARSIPGLVAYTFSAFVLASIVLEFVRGTRARKALGGGVVARRVRVARRAQPAPLRRLRRARGDRPARDRRRRLERLRLGRRGEARAGPVDADRRLHARRTGRSTSATAPNATEIRATLDVAARRSRARHARGRARTRTRSSSRSRTRSGSAPTGSRARTCS